MQWRTQPAIPVLKNGVYPGTLEKLDVQPSQFPGGKDRLKWTFVVTLPELPTHDYEILAWTNLTFHEGDPEFVWASAALGRPLGTNEPVEEQDLIGQPVRLKITPTTNQKTGRLQYNLDAVFPAASSEDAEAGMVAQPKEEESDVPF